MRLDRPTTIAANEEQGLPAEFRLREERLDRTGRVLVASGDLDVATAPALRKRLNEAIEAGVTRLVLDLSDVSFIDSLSLAAIVAAKRRLGDEGRVAVVAHHPYVLLIFEAGGLDAVVELFQTREEATAYARG
jgi:anti-sigma B factor antagonist